MTVTRRVPSSCRTTRVSFRKTEQQDGLPLGHTNAPQFNALGPNVDKEMNRALLSAAADHNAKLGLKSRLPI